jgi:hypothetical protein
MAIAENLVVMLIRHIWDQSTFEYLVRNRCSYSADQCSPHLRVVAQQLNDPLRLLRLRPIVLSDELLTRRLPIIQKRRRR